MLSIVAGDVASLCFLESPFRFPFKALIYHKLTTGNWVQIAVYFTVALVSIYQTFRLLGSATYYERQTADGLVQFESAGRPAEEAAPNGTR